MAKIVLNIDTPDAGKLKRALEAHALQQGQTVEECLLPVLRGIAQHVGLDANDDEAGQEESLTRAERRGTKAKQGREAIAAEAARLVAESEARRKAAEAAVAAAAAPKAEPTTTPTN